MLTVMGGSVMNIMSKKVLVKCDFCGTEFLRFPSAVGERNFCSHICAKKYQFQKPKSVKNQARWHRLVIDFEA